MTIIRDMEPLTEDEIQGARLRQARRQRDEAALKQYAEREHLRGEIRSREYIGLIHTGITMLYSGHEHIVTPSGETITRELDRTRQAGVKSALDACFKMLNKTMPDLKQIELRADVTEEALPTTITYTVIRPEIDE